MLQTTSAETEFGLMESETPSYYATYNISNGLTGTSMTQSYSRSSAGSSHQQSTARQYSGDSPAETAQKYTQLLSMYQPGTPDYNKVHKAYSEWYTRFSSGLVSDNVTVKEESPPADYDDDDDNDSGEYSFETPQGITTMKPRTVVDTNGKQ